MTKRKCLVERIVPSPELRQTRQIAVSHATSILRSQLPATSILSTTEGGTSASWASSFVPRDTDIRTLLITILLI